MLVFNLVLTIYFELKNLKIIYIRYVFSSTKVYLFVLQPNIVLIHVNCTL